MDQYLKKLKAKDCSVNPIFTFMGMQLVHAQDGQSCISMRISKNIVQEAGHVAGGMLATLADEAMAHAAMSLRYESVVTTEMNIRFLRSPEVVDGAELLGKAKVEKAGKHLIYLSAEVTDAEGVVYAVAGGTFFVVTS